MENPTNIPEILLKNLKEKYHLKFRNMRKKLYDNQNLNDDLPNVPPTDPTIPIES